MDNTLPTTPQSGYFLYGIGRATHDIERGSKLLKVADIEKMPMQHGKLNDKSTTVTSNSSDALGKTHAAKGKIGSGIPCTWINYFGNRLIAPDIRKGERVLIWRYGDSKDYFWTPTNLDEEFRTLEHLLLGVSNRSSKGKGKLNRDNTYYLELDTYNKIINLQTSKSDGEKYIYNIRIDGKKHTVFVGDNVGNEYSIDSLNTKVQLKNKDGSVFTLDKKDIALNCSGNYTATVANSYTVTCESYTVNSQTNTFSASESTFSGAITCASLSIGGAGKSGGSACTVRGGMNVQGGIDADQIKVGDGGIQSTGPITAPNLMYN